MSEPLKNTIYLAGGCFWGVEELFQNLPGVISTRVGYTGGTVENPTYEIVKTGESGHAEAIEINYEPKQLPLEDLLKFFFSIHDPTTMNQQGNDKGSQYRSAIFYNSELEKNLATSVIKELENENRWPKSIVTQIEFFQSFYSAENFHQNYLKKNPGGYTCHWQRYDPTD